MSFETTYGPIRIGPSEKISLVPEIGFKSIRDTLYANGAANYTNDEFYIEGKNPIDFNYMLDSIAAKDPLLFKNKALPKSFEDFRLFPFRNVFNFDILYHYTGSQVVITFIADRFLLSNGFEPNVRIKVNIAYGNDSVSTNYYKDITLTWTGSRYRAVETINKSFFQSFVGNNSKLNLKVSYDSNYDSQYVRIFSIYNTNYTFVVPNLGSTSRVYPFTTIYQGRIRIDESIYNSFNSMGYIKKFPYNAVRDFIVDIVYYQNKYWATAIRDGLYYSAYYPITVTTYFAYNASDYEIENDYSNSYLCCSKAEIFTNTGRNDYSEKTYYNCPVGYGPNGMQYPSVSAPLPQGSGNMSSSFYSCGKTYGDGRCQTGDLNFDLDDI